ncbi:GNAT family N-acetyltransferase [Flavicella sediminum]|uniref:GNAT family N-acetyltransferase n=1 Tax=Flavicella sediminum TaxID=2585141 RepID=UPI00111F1A9A|nr:GNAT family N-acetyltransferase [Flavicella sediminum]
MKTTTELINDNLQNLTDLWKTAGRAFNAYEKTSNFDFCEIKGSAWPNRIWFQKPITEENLPIIQQKLTTASSYITLPIWQLPNKKQETLLKENGFKLRFEQVGMSLKIDEAFAIATDFKIQRVTNSTQIKIWADLFFQAFKYVISIETIEKTLQDIPYYIAYDKDTPVGTAIAYASNNSMGIHSVGIPPEMRRRGYAEQLMKQLINLALSQQMEYVSLQASAMGKNIYLKLGFTELFVIQNYVLQA